MNNFGTFYYLSYLSTWSPVPSCIRIQLLMINKNVSSLLNKFLYIYQKLIFFSFGVEKFVFWLQLIQRVFNMRIALNYHYLIYRYSYLIVYNWLVCFSADCISWKWACYCGFEYWRCTSDSQGNHYATGICFGHGYPASI